MKSFGRAPSSCPPVARVREQPAALTFFRHDDTPLFIIVISSLCDAPPVAARRVTTPGGLGSSLEFLVKLDVEGGIFMRGTKNRMECRERVWLFQSRAPRVRGFRNLG